MTELTNREMRRAKARLRARQHAKQASMIALSGMLAAYGTLWRSQRAYASPAGVSCGSVADFPSLNVAIANFNNAVDNCDTIYLPASTIVLAANATAIAFPAGASALHIVGLGADSYIQGAGHRLFDVTMSAGDELHVSDVTLHNARVAQARYNDGAALRVLAPGAGTVVQISNVTFDGNQADSGGAVWSNAETLQIDQSTFTANGAFGDGGAISGTGSLLLVSDSTFRANQANGNYGGGAIDDAWLSAEITRSDFDQNFSSGPRGGALDQRFGTETLTVSASTFENNHATEYGGAIYADAPLVVTGSTFRNNYAKFGGAITAYNSTLIATCDFLDNGKNLYDQQVTEFGGALDLVRGTSVIRHSDFFGNVAADRGGAIVTDGYATVTIETSDFTNNVAYGFYNESYYGKGGAIYAGMGDGDVSGALSIASTTFHDNYAYFDGGAIFSGVPTTMDTSTLMGNVASQGNGGAIWTSAPLSVEGSRIASNVASSGGGGIYAWGPNTEVKLSSVTVFQNNLSNQQADPQGAGGVSVPQGMLYVANSSILDNEGSYNGAGGVSAHGLRLYYSTIAQNHDPHGWNANIALFSYGDWNGSLDSRSSIIASTLPYSSCRANFQPQYGPGEWNLMLEHTVMTDDSCFFGNAIPMDTNIADATWSEAFGVDAPAFSTATVNGVVQTFIKPGTDDSLVATLGKTGDLYSFDWFNPYFDQIGNARTGTFSVGAIQRTVPSITTVSPDSGSVAGGTAVTVTGAHLESVTAVFFGAETGTVVSASADTVTVTSPAHAAGLVDVTLWSGSESATASEAFTFVDDAVAETSTIASVIRSSGRTVGGSTVTITGTHFESATAVTFGGLSATLLAIASDSITVTTPAHAAGLVDVTVWFGAESVTARGAYTYGAVSAPPVIPVRAVVLGWPGTTSIVYGTAISAALLNATADVDGRFEYLVDGKAALGAVLSAGIYTVTANFVANDSTFFTGGSVTHRLVVTAAPATVSVGSASKVEGSADPLFPLSITGLVNGDAASVFGALVPTRVAGEGPGTYAVTVTAAAANYAVSVVAGSLTISPKPPTVEHFRDRVMFMGTSTVLSKAGKQVLRDLVAEVAGQAQRIQVIGFVAHGKTDAQGLSGKRAAVVAAFLKSLGLAGSYEVRGGGHTISIGADAQRVGVRVTSSK